MGFDSDSAWKNIDWEVNRDSWTEKEIKEEIINEKEWRKEMAQTGMNTESMDEIIAKYITNPYTKTTAMKIKDNLIDDIVILKTRNGKHKYNITSEKRARVEDKSFNWLNKESYVKSVTGRIGSTYSNNPCGEIKIDVSQPDASITFNTAKNMVFSLNYNGELIINFMADGKTETGYDFTTNQRAAQLFFNALGIEWSEKFKEMNKSIIGEREMEIRRLEAENEELRIQVNMLNAKTIRTRNV